MTASRKERRGKRVPAVHRLLITSLAAGGAEFKEIVSTVEVSQHGARVRGRRALQPDSRGTITQLSSGRQAPFRVAWQRRGSDPNSLDTGVEFLSSIDFWGAIFSGSAVQPTPAPPASPVRRVPEAQTAVESVGPVISPADLLDELRKAAQQSSSGDQKTRVLEAVWCALIEQLEERQVFTRQELLTAIRSVGIPTSAALKASGTN